jgi:hypothetical protein
MQTFIGVVFSAENQEFSNNLSTTNVGLEPLIFLFTLTLADKNTNITFYLYL